MRFSNARFPSHVMHRAYATVLVCFFMACHPVAAENLGRLAPTYPIAEQDARKYFEAQATRAFGSAAAVRDSARKSALNFLASLPPIEGMQPVGQSRTRYVDLLHAFSRDVTDAKGRVVVSAGTKFDLLRHGRLSGYLLILDGRDFRQIQMLDRLWRSGYQVTPILVAGSYTQLSSKFRRPLYYDYGGAISARFDVKAVPALIGQDGNRIRIEELKP